MTSYLQQLFGLDGQVAVVIGGTGVLGGGLCDGLGKAGAHVVVAGRSEERGEARAKILDEKRVENIMRNTPRQRFGEPLELVGAVLLMVSRSAGSFITGAEIYVDGGFTACDFDAARI